MTDLPMRLLAIAPTLAEHWPLAAKEMRAAAKEIDALKSQLAQAEARGEVKMRERAAKAVEFLTEGESCHVCFRMAETIRALPVEGGE